MNLGVPLAEGTQFEFDLWRIECLNACPLTLLIEQRGAACIEIQIWLDHQYMPIGIQT